jgi:hypothetical protein
LKKAQLAFEHKFGHSPFSFATFKKIFTSLALRIPNALKDSINIPIPFEIMQQIFYDGHYCLRLLLH